MDPLNSSWRARSMLQASKPDPASAYHATGLSLAAVLTLCVPVLVLVALVVFFLVVYTMCSSHWARRYQESEMPVEGKPAPTMCAMTTVVVEGTQVVSTFDVVMGSPVDPPGTTTQAAKPGPRGKRSYPVHLPPALGVPVAPRPSS